jgi:hypothetical protein
MDEVRCQAASQRLGHSQRRRRAPRSRALDGRPDSGCLRLTARATGKLELE